MEFHSKDYVDTLESYSDQSEDEQRLKQFGLGKSTLQNIQYIITIIKGL